MTALLLTAGLMTLTLAGYGAAIVAGKLRWTLAIRIMYARETASAWIASASPRARSYLTRARAMVRGLMTARKGRKGNGTMDKQLIAAIAQAVAVAVATALDSKPEPAPVKVAPPKPEPEQTASAPAPKPARKVASKPAPKPAPEQTAPVAGGDVVVHVDSDGAVLRVQRKVSDSLTLDVQVEGRDGAGNRQPAHRTMIPPKGAPAIGRLLTWTGAKGRPCRGMIVGANRNGKLRVQRIGDNGAPMAAVMYRASDAVYAPGDAGVNVRFIREHGPKGITASGKGLALAPAPAPKPEPAPEPAPVDRDDPLAILFAAQGGEQTSAPAPEQTAPKPEPASAGGLAPAPVPAPAPSKEPALRWSRVPERIAIPGFGDGQTFAPSDRLVVLVNSEARLARTSKGAVRWFLATSRKGKAALDAPASVKGFHAYVLDASAVASYVASGDYS
jgi:hypothetical protein